MEVQGVGVLRPEVFLCVEARGGMRRVEVFFYIKYFFVIISYLMNFSRVSFIIQRRNECDAGEY